jgi:ribosomal protein S27AE
VEDHTAKTLDGAPLRLAHTLCPRCGHARIVYFSIRPPLPN